MGELCVGDWSAAQHAALTVPLTSALFALSRVCAARRPCSCLRVQPDSVVRQSARKADAAQHGHWCFMCVSNCMANCHRPCTQSAMGSSLKQARRHSNWLPCCTMEGIRACDCAHTKCSAPSSWEAIKTGCSYSCMLWHARAWCHVSWCYVSLRGPRILNGSA